MSTLENILKNNILKNQDERDERYEEMKKDHKKKVFEVLDALIESQALFKTVDYKDINIFEFKHDSYESCQQKCYIKSYDCDNLTLAISKVNSKLDYKLDYDLSESNNDKLYKIVLPIGEFSNVIRLIGHKDHPIRLVMQKENCKNENFYIDFITLNKRGLNDKLIEKNICPECFEKLYKMEFQQQEFKKYDEYVKEKDIKICTNCNKVFDANKKHW